MAEKTIIEEAKKGKIVVMASRDVMSKIIPKSREDAERVAVVVVGEK